jgi:BlaI family transcriptional regulator, penicillinase repressor
MRMPRPSSDLPTPTELVVLNYIYANGPSVVNDVWRNDPRGKRRAYTSVMSLMSVMFEKGLLDRKTEKRAYRYSAKISQSELRKRILDYALNQGFGGSVGELLKTLGEIGKFVEADVEAARAFAEQARPRGKGKK